MWYSCSKCRTVSSADLPLLKIVVLLENLLRETDVHVVNIIATELYVGKAQNYNSYDKNCTWFWQEWKLNVWNIVTWIHLVAGFSDVPYKQ